MDALFTVTQQCLNHSYYDVKKKKKTLKISWAKKVLKTFTKFGPNSSTFWYNPLNSSSEAYTSMCIIRRQYSRVSIYT